MKTTLLPLLTLACACLSGCSSEATSGPPLADEDTSSAEQAVAMPCTNAVPNDGGSYKDSFYFAYGGTKYLVVSDLGRGGISLLRAFNNNDADYRFAGSLVAGLYYAPQVVDLGGGVFQLFVSHIPGGPASNNATYTTTWNINTGAIGQLSQLLAGVYDASVHYEPTLGAWLLFGAKWTLNVGVRLVWSKSQQVGSGYSAPKQLYTSATGTQRVDLDRYGPSIDWIVEAPIWSWWDHDGEGRHELYWSVGPSSPNSGFTTSIRRGNIHFSAGVPWISLWDPNFTDKITAQNGDSGLLTHPDFTETGKMRGTSYMNGRYVICNTANY